MPQNEHLARDRASESGIAAAVGSGLCGDHMRLIIQVESGLSSPHRVFPVIWR
jgi:NifU-like protein involved in Fe-S cluster formation